MKKIVSLIIAFSIISVSSVSASGVRSGTGGSGGSSATPCNGRLHTNAALNSGCLCLFKDNPSGCCSSTNVTSECSYNAQNTSIGDDVKFQINASSIHNAHIIIEFSGDMMHKRIDIRGTPGGPHLGAHYSNVVSLAVWGPKVKIETTVKGDRPPCTPPKCDPSWESYAVGGSISVDLGQ